MTSAPRYVALIRGINVGGSNIIRMSDLKECFEGLGFADVATYIQSGNVLFRAPKAKRAAIAAEIEKGLSARFGLRGSLVLLDRASLRRIIDEAPKGFGKSPERFRYDVIFLREPMTSKEALVEVRTREGVDEAHAGSRALYFSRLVRLASRSHLSRITRHPAYSFMTLRNWNTTTKLLELIES